MVHVCPGRDCPDAAVADGQLVCPHTGRVVGPVFVTGFKSVAEAARSSENAVGPLGEAGAEQKMFDETDRQDQHVRQELSSILEIASAALCGSERAGPSYAFDPDLPLVESFVLHRRAARGDDAERVRDLAHRIHAYYRWCVRRTNGTRVPKLRLFVLAMLYVMTTGLSAAGVFIVPASPLCAARMPEISKIPGNVLKDRQRALTTAIKFVKATFGDAVAAMGPYKLLQNISETFMLHQRSTGTFP